MLTRCSISLFITSRIIEDNLNISVTDQGISEVALAKLLENDRTGLKNVNQRLMTFYRRKLEFEIPFRGGLKVNISIPVEGGV